jgi:purine-binding chemotaxis protein CheW
MKYMNNTQQQKTRDNIQAQQLAPEYIKGLLNLRGQIVTIIDLRQRLGFDPLDDNTEGMNLIVTVDKDLMSVFIDQIGDVVAIHGDRLSPPSWNHTWCCRPLYSGGLSIRRRTPDCAGFG